MLVPVQWFDILTTFSGFLSIICSDSCMSGLFYEIHDMMFLNKRPPAPQRRVLWAVGCMKASFLGVVHKEPMTEKKFVGWKAIPYKKGFVV